MSIREAIFVAVEQALSAIPGVAAIERMPSGDPAEFPNLAIYDGGQDVLSEGEAGSTRYRLSLSIEAFVTGADDKTVHAEMSALHAAVVAAMLAEPPLGGLVEIVAERGMRISVATLADDGRMGFALDFDIQFSTRRGDPTAQ